MAKMGFCLFWSFLPVWGWIFHPHGPSSFFSLLSLTPTLLVTNSIKVLTTVKKKLSFILSLFVVFATCSPPAPPGQMSTPGERPWGHPLVILVFPLLFSNCAVDFTPTCIMKWILLLKYILPLTEVKMPDFSLFCHFCRV